MRFNYARNAGRPWAVRILLESPQPGAARRAQAMPFEDSASRQVRRLPPDTGALPPPSAVR